MAYKIYRNVSVLEIKTEKVTPTKRTRDIVDPVMARESYSVRVAKFSNYVSGTTHNVEKFLNPPGNLSVAINDQEQIIAVVNHVSGMQGMSLDKPSLKVGEIFGALFFIVPLTAFGLWLSYRSIPWFEAGDEKGFILAGIGLGALALAFFIAKNFIMVMGEDKKALKELLKK